MEESIVFYFSLSNKSTMDKDINNNSNKIARNKTKQNFNKKMWRNKNKDIVKMVTVIKI